MNKRGEEPIPLETYIFYILNAAFFFIMLAGVYYAGSGAVYYEQVYAKKIALILDQANPDSTFLISMDDGLKVANKQKQLVEKIVDVNSTKGIVTVTLTSKHPGYRYAFFSNVSVDGHIEGKYLVLSVKEAK